MRIDRLGLLQHVPPLNLARVPRDLDAVTDIGPEQANPGRKVERIWTRARELYASGAHPALQVCVRHHGEVVLDRAIGHARGNGPTPDGFAPEPMTVRTPVSAFSTSKGITAMLVLMLAERGFFDLDDPVAEHVPGFRGEGREKVTVRHVLTHRSGIPHFPRDAWPDRTSPEGALRAVCEAPLVSAAGERLAYHVVSGGYLLEAVICSATGHTLREVLHKEILAPLGFRWTNYGVPESAVDLVARNYVTGPSTPVTWHVERAFGERLQEFVDLSNSPIGLTSTVASASVVSTAEELCRFYEIFRAGGTMDGIRIATPETVRLAMTETSRMEVDGVLGVPLLRWGHGQMLGARHLGIFGPDTGHAFGHLGFTQSIAWADPDRGLSAAILTTGKPLVGPGSVAWLRLVRAITASSPKVAPS